MKLLLTTLLMVMCVASEIQAKRLAPPEIDPIEKGGLIFLHKFQRQGSGYTVYLMAEKSLDKSIVWKAKIYQKDYDENLEEDAQDIHLVSLELIGKTLIAKDERGQIYKVDSSTGKLLSPDKEVIYPKGL